MGRLQDLVVKPGTLQRYREQFNRFCDWADDNEFSLTSSWNIDSACAHYIEGLWSDGSGKSEGAYLLAAVQFLLPSLKHELPLSWRLLKTWDRHEFPTRAVPLDGPTVLAFAGLFWAWQEFHLAAGIVVAFDFFLRTGELFTLRRNQVEFFAGGATLQLLDTKSSSHRIHSERLLVWDKLALHALTFLASGLFPGDKLVPTSPAHFRRLWHRAVNFFALTDYYIQPYSLRRGGATSAFRRGTPFPQILLRGRWSHQKTARIYIDEALQQSASLQFGPTTRTRLAWARQQLPPTGFTTKGRAEGRRSATCLRPTR